MLRLNKTITFAFEHTNNGEQHGHPLTTADQHICFATLIVQSLYLPNTKFQAINLFDGQYTVYSPVGSNLVGDP